MMDGMTPDKSKPALVAYFEANERGRDFVVGDLHGCYSLLMGRLEAVSFDRSVDRLFCTGDLVDRGTDSLACLRLIDEPWFFAVRGNHEDLMLANLLPHASTSPYLAGSWVPNGGNWFFGEWPTPQDVPINLMRSVASLPFIIVVRTASGKRINILHAELPEGRGDDYIDDGAPGGIEQIIWGRQRVGSPDVDYSVMDGGLSTTFVGHSVVPAPLSLGSYVFIDTGAVFTGILTMVQLP